MIAHQKTVRGFRGNDHFLALGATVKSGKTLCGITISNAQGGLRDSEVRCPECMALADDGQQRYTVRFKMTPKQRTITIEDGTVTVSLDAKTRRAAIAEASKLVNHPSAWPLYPEYDFEVLR